MPDWAEEHRHSGARRINGLLVIVWRASVGDRTITRLTEGDQGHDDGDAAISPSASACRLRAFVRPIVTSRRRRGGSLELWDLATLDDASGVPVLIERGHDHRADLDVP